MINYDTMTVDEQLAVLKEQVGGEFTLSPSPLTRWLKPSIISAERGKLVFKYTVREDMTNPVGSLHGGVTASIIDDIIGATIFSFNEPNFYTTINLNIDYMAGARLNDVVIAETHVVKKGKQFINAQCEVWNEDRSRLIARGYTNLFKTTVERK